MYKRTAEMWYSVPTCSHPASPAVNVLPLNIRDICQNQETDVSSKLLLKNRLCTFMVLMQFLRSKLLPTLLFCLTSNFGDKTELEVYSNVPA